MPASVISTNWYSLVHYIQDTSSNNTNSDATNGIYYKHHSIDHGLLSQSKANCRIVLRDLLGYHMLKMKPRIKSLLSLMVWLILALQWWKKAFRKVQTASHCLCCMQKACNKSSPLRRKCKPLPIGNSHVRVYAVIVKNMISNKLMSVVWWKWTLVLII